MEPFSIFSLGDCLLVSVQEEIDDRSIKSLTGLLGERVAEKNARAVIIDLHDVEIVDTFLAEHLAGLVSFLSLLRAKVMVAGLQAPVILALIDFDIRLKGVGFALDVEQALAKLNR
ncbi:MAG: STAS domain-containing protein [Dissulfurimicrobium sp.]|uniref:STAS domain-containing protein n=1 Tax=Dissulfurimicrobium sp. TaxID=2022436 RepID=UPI003D0E9DD1